VANRDLKTRFTGDTSGLTRATSEAERAVKGTESTFASSAKKMAAVGAGFAAGFVVDKGVELLAGAVGKASDLAESMSKVGKAFGDSAASMDGFIKGADKIGLSDAAAAELAGNLGVLGGQLGLADDASASMAKTVIGLGADLGSFNNLETGDVVERIQKAMTGELDGMKQLTPALNAQMVAQRALADTGKATTDELTAQEKATATLALITEQSADALGDFAETSDGAANQSKIMAAQMDDMQTSLGGKLLPLWESFQRMLLEDVLPALEQFGAWISENVPPIYEEYFKPTFDAIAELVAGFVEFVLVLWDQFGGTIVKVLLNAFNNILGIVKPALDILRNVIKTVTALIKGDWAGVWDGLKGIVKGALDLVLGIFGAFKNNLTLAVDLLGDVLAAPFRVMRDLAATAFNAIARFWNNSVGKLSFKAPGWVPGNIGWDVPDIPTVSAAGRMAPAAAVVLNLPAGTDGYSMVATLRGFDRMGGSTDLTRVAVS
jgi:hypothetical protein